MTEGHIPLSASARLFIFNEIIYMNYLSVAIFLLASSCLPYQKPITSEKSKNNDAYTVEYLFEHEGCKVYRFYDRGNYVYFTNCNGETVVQTDSTELRNSIKVNKK